MQPWLDGLIVQGSRTLGDVLTARHLPVLVLVEDVGQDVISLFRLDMGKILPYELSSVLSLDRLLGPFAHSVDDEGVVAQVGCQPWCNG